MTSATILGVFGHPSHHPDFDDFLEIHAGGRDNSCADQEWKMRLWNEFYSSSEFFGHARFSKTCQKLVFISCGRLDF